MKTKLRMNDLNSDENHEINHAEMELASLTEANKNIVRRKSSKILIQHKASIRKEASERTFTINSDEANEEEKFITNYIRTTKYTFYNFIPKSLLMQFLRFANIYFLIIAILQSIPKISPLNPVTAIVPLIFVLCVSMLREGIEDYNRYKEDKRTNSKPVRVFTADESTLPPRSGLNPRVSAQTLPSPSKMKKNYGNWVKESPLNFRMVESKDIKVGQIVYIEEDEIFPADIILLGTSNPDLTCYVETSSLDGEKNLKKKITSERINDLCQREMIMMHASVKCKPQTRSLSDFDAVIHNHSIRLETALNQKQLLLKGAKLKNTLWITGVVAYTGDETKIMVNSQVGGFKESKVERLMNKFILMILLIQFTLCVVIGALSAYWHDSRIDQHDYIQYDDSG